MLKECRENMPLPRRSRSRLPAAILIAFSLSLAAVQSRAAEPKDWVTITNCRYVFSADSEGDFFKVQTEAKEFVLRLYYVETPEADPNRRERVRDQGEYYGTTLEETVKVGAQARDRVRELLKEPFVVQTRWATVAGRSRETRYYGVVLVDRKSLAEILLAEGLARAKGLSPNPPGGEKANAYLEKLDKLQAEAREKRLGIWAVAKEKKPASVPATKPEP